MPKPVKKVVLRGLEVFFFSKSYFDVNGVARSLPKWSGPNCVWLWHGHFFWVACMNPCPCACVKRFGSILLRPPCDSILFSTIWRSTLLPWQSCAWPRHVIVVLTLGTPHVVNCLLMLFALTRGVNWPFEGFRNALSLVWSRYE